MKAANGNGEFRWKILLVFLFLLSTPYGSNGQGSSELTVYDEDGVAFYLSMNGEQKNEGEQSSRVKVDSIAGGSYELLIRYPDTSIPELQKSIQLKSFVSRTYAIHTIQGREKREWSLISQVRSEGERDSRREGAKSNTVHSDPESRALPEVDSAFIASYKGNRGCSDPLSSAAFETIFKKVEKAIFEKERIRIAKRGIAKRCVLSSQVALLMKSFNYEENRLDLAKYAYGRTFDQKNYDTVREALHFERSHSELELYLEKLR